MKSVTSVALYASIALAMVAGKAHAQYITYDNEYQSPQSYYLEIKFGPYAPDIDSEFSEATPFADIFGDGRDLMIKGELEFEIWRGFGTVALGGVLGYYNNTTEAFRDSGDSGTSTSTERSSSTTSISLVPMAVLGIYRFDYPAVEFSIPLVPFVKFGFNYTLWWINVDDQTSSYNGEEASGGTLGWQLNIGAAFLLDVLDPHAAKTLDVDLGVNHTYLFFEYVRLQANGLGSKSALHVGDSSWLAGIAFEF